MGILKLPYEVLAQIFEHFTHPVARADQGQFPAPPQLELHYDTLHALCLSSKHFLPEAQAKLYRHARLSPILHEGPGDAWADLELIGRTILSTKNSQRVRILASHITSLHVCWSANHAYGHHVPQLIAACPNLSYLSLDFEHHGDGFERLPVESMLDLLERKPHLQTLNMRFTEVDVHLEHLYIPSCLRIRVAGLRSLRLKGVPTAALHRNFVHPLPNLQHLRVEYFDLPPVQLAEYIEMVTAMTSLKELELVDLEEPSDTLTHLPVRLHSTLTRLTVDLDSSSLDLRALSSFSQLRHLNLGYSPFQSQDLQFLPKTLRSLALHPGTLDQLVSLTTALVNKSFLPCLRTIRLCGSQEAFWDSEDSREQDWQLAKKAVEQFTVFARKKDIEVEPPDWPAQLDERYKCWWLKVGLQLIFNLALV